MSGGDHLSEVDLSSDTPDDGAPEEGSLEGETENLEVDAVTDEPVRGGSASVEPSEAVELQAIVAERDDYLEALRRLQAEFENYRKRTVRQQTELLGRASESLIERLLPVLDALDLAIEHSQSGADITAALQQIGTLSRDTLQKEGLERIDEAGVPFDPTVHDAVAHLPHEEDDGGTGVVVEEILRPGYQLKGRVLRPTMVRVRG